jgi:hypothetical protein
MVLKVLGVYIFGTRTQLTTSNESGRLGTITIIIEDKFAITKNWGFTRISIPKNTMPSSEVIIDIFFLLKWTVIKIWIKYNVTPENG